MDADIAYMGDDVVDLAVLARVGMATAPGDCCVPEVASRAHWVTDAAGGAGAAGELVERILPRRGHWEGVVDSYLHEPNDVGSPAR